MRLFRAFIFRFGSLCVCLQFCLAPAGAAEEKWIKISGEHFAVLTSASESVARSRAIEFEQFRRALQDIFPVPEAKVRPVTVVLFRNQRTMDPYLPLEKGKPAKLAGYFVRTNDLNTITLNLDNDAGETKRVIYHEAVHWHLSAFEGFMPLWLGEAVAELYSTFTFRDAKSYQFGDPIEGHVVLLREHDLMPLQDLLELGRGSLLYNEGSKATIFYAQAWALIHYLTYGEGSPGRQTLHRYIVLMREGRTSTQAFSEAFGAPIATIERQLRDYIDRGSYRRMAYPRATGDIEQSLKTTAVAPGELDLAKGSLLVGANRSADALTFLQQATRAAPQDPRAWEVLGALALGRRDYDEAQSLLGKAVDAGSTSYLVYHNLAVTLLPRPGTFPTTPDPREMDRAASLYRRAIAIAPARVEPYEGLAGVMQAAPTFQPEDLELLVRGSQLAPHNMMIEVGIAVGEIRAGNVEKGRERLGEIVAKNDSGRSETIAFARSVLANEKMKDYLQRIDGLAKGQKFSEAIAVIDEALATDLPDGHRKAMVENRRRLDGYQTLTMAIATANSGDFSLAKKQLEDLIATKPELGLSMEAQRLLANLRRSEENAAKRKK